MKKFGLALFFCFIISFTCHAEQIDLTASDLPNDDGSGIILRWSMEGIKPTEILIERSTDGKTFERLALESGFASEFIDREEISPGETFYYRIKALDEESVPIAESAIVSAESEAQWFNTNKLPLLIMTLLLSIAVVYYIFSARKGKKLYIRRISGLDSIDEAIGRATEMGRPLLFVPGINDLDDIQTIAGLTILSHIAKKVAEYDSSIHVPVARSVVLSTAREIVKEAYLSAGRPDAFNPDSVFYLTDDQFGYVAGVDGIIMREKPAATFFLGAFYAESLILAETGFYSGAIQIAGTAMPAQLPFFVAACDYTLIGEELFAASAYLSNEPAQLGSLKGQDIGKIIVIATILLGVILEIFGVGIIREFLTIY
jgi:hypothetical protein